MWHFTRVKTYSDPSYRFSGVKTRPPTQDLRPCLYSMRSSATAVASGCSSAYSRLRRCHVFGGISGIALVSVLSSFGVKSWSCHQRCCNNRRISHQPVLFRFSACFRKVDRCWGFSGRSLITDKLLELIVFLKRNYRLTRNCSVIAVIRWIYMYTWRRFMFVSAFSSCCKTRPCYWRCRQRPC